MPTIVNGEPENWPDVFEAGKLHVVCVAEGGLTTCDLCACTLGGMKQEEEVWPLTKRVNLAGETGTFWPRFPLTVVPQPYWEGRPAPSDLEDFYRASFLDVATANREHVRLGVMFIDLNGYGTEYHFSAARRIAEDVLVCEPSIETIYFAEELT